MAEHIRTRSEIEPQYKWNLTHIFPSAEDWEHAILAVDSKITSFSNFAGHIAQTPEEAIRAYFEINTQILPVSSYAFLSKEADNGDTHAQAMEDRVMSVWVKWNTASSFLLPELLSLSDEQLETLQHQPDTGNNKSAARSLQATVHNCHLLSRAPLKDFPCISHSCLCSRSLPYKHRL